MTLEERLIAASIDLRHRERSLESQGYFVHELLRLASDKLYSQMKIYAELAKDAARVDAENARLREVWQPIETAPTDGTWVLVRGGQFDFNSDYEMDECEDAPPCVVAKFMPEDNCWRYCSYDGGFYGEYDNPTEWMLLHAAHTEKDE